MCEDQNYIGISQPKFFTIFKPSTSTNHDDQLSPMSDNEKKGYSTEVQKNVLIGTISTIIILVFIAFFLFFF